MMGVKMCLLRQAKQKPMVAGLLEDKYFFPSNVIWLVVDLPLRKTLVNWKDYPIYYGKNV
jgi:hypothetical protein